jgi:DNA-binding NarL/FixJ family response regulator
VIVDDHPIVRKGLTELINHEPDMTVCGESDTADGSLERIRVDQPDVAVVDLSLGMESGLN